MASAPPRVADAPPAPASSVARDRAVEEVDRVFRIVKEELGVLVKTSTPTTKLIAGVLACSFVAHLLLGRWTAPVLALVPEKTVPCVWNVVTSGFYEMNAISFAVDVLGVLYLGRLLEPIWGTAEFVRFVVVAQCAVGVSAFVTMYALYVCTRSQYFLFAQFGGFHGVLVALTVALRQQLPEERVPLPPPVGAALRLRNKHLPGAYLVAAGALSVANGAKHHHIGLWLFAAYGALAGWCYLRYFQRVQRRKEGGAGAEDAGEVAYGDDREEFEFAAQFPDACAPAVRAVTDPIHALVFGGKPRYVALAAAAPTGAAANADEPESAAEADARRARAARGARLLEEKLKSASASEKPRDGANRELLENAEDLA
jgi:membrane associated rhomboid family serine protease